MEGERSILQFKQPASQGNEQSGLIDLLEFNLRRRREKADLWKEARSAQGLSSEDPERERMIEEMVS